MIGQNMVGMLSNPHTKVSPPACKRLLFVSMASTNSCYPYVTLSAIPSTPLGEDT